MRKFTIGVLLSISSICIALACAEGYLRIQDSQQFNMVAAWDFNPKAGFTFRPNSALGFNSFGFNDVEHSIDKPDGVLRIMICGASFVGPEGFPKTLSRLLAARYPDRRFEIILVTGPGIGLGDILALYEEFGRRFHPDLVLAVFTSIDFTRSSPLLEGIRQRFNPAHPPRVFLDLKQPTADGTQFTRLNIDADFNAKAPSSLPVLPTSPYALDHLLSWSRLYQKALAGLENIFRKPIHHSHEYIYRLAQFRLEPSLREQLEGWRYPDDLDLDDMFYSETMPQAFDNAVAITEETLRHIDSAVRLDGGRFLLVTTDECGLILPYRRLRMEPLALKAGRTIRDDALSKRLSRSKSFITTIDLYPFFLAKGDPVAAHLANDLHWNEIGHQWAGEGIFEFITTHENDLLGPSR